MIDDPCLAPIRPTDCDLSDEYRPILVSILVERQTHVKNPRPPPVKKHNDDLRPWLRLTGLRLSGHILIASPFQCSLFTQKDGGYFYKWIPKCKMVERSYYSLDYAIVCRRTIQTHISLSLRLWIVGVVMSLLEGPLSRTVEWKIVYDFYLIEKLCNYWWNHRRQLSTNVFVSI